MVIEDLRMFLDQASAFALATLITWNPVLELHKPLPFCKRPPKLLGQRDVESGRVIAHSPALGVSTRQ